MFSILEGFYLDVFCLFPIWQVEDPEVFFELLFSEREPGRVVVGLRNPKRLGCVFFRFRLDDHNGSNGAFLRKLDNDMGPMFLVRQKISRLIP